VSQKGFPTLSIVT